MQLRSLLACSTVLLVACSSEDERATPETLAGPRSVILISIDSVRADHCSAWGYRPRFAPEQRTTPFLDRMASTGVRFVDAQAASPWTLPSHVSLLTGMHCLEHGVRTRATRLDDSVETLAERFQAAGYATGGFYSAPFLHPAWGFARGFDHYEPAAPYLRGLETLEALAEGSREALEPLHEMAHADARTSERVVDAALRWLDDEDRWEEPFFLFLHLWDPHYDYAPPEEIADLFLEEGMGPKTFEGFWRGEWDPDVELERVIALYDAEIRYTDGEIERLWSRIESRGLDEHTILAITSDHGDEFFEHGQKGHHKTLFEEVTHVPMVIRASGRVPAARVVEQPVATYDLAPTLLDLADLEPWPERTGRSLEYLWERGPAFPVDGHELLLDLKLSRGPELQAYRYRWTKVVWDRKRDTFTLFDLLEDGSEQEPSVASNDPRSLTTRARVEAWRDHPGHTAPMEETDNMRRMLGGLGYVEDDDGSD